MSRIYDALKRAEQERSVAEPVPLPPAPEAAAEFVPAPEFVPTVPVVTDRLPFAFERVVSHKWSPDGTRLVFANDASWGTAAAEEFRRLRSRLHLDRDARHLKSVLVGSAIAGEGKTFIAGNLAHVFARQSECRVLLIDADLRKPNLHDVLLAPAGPGVSDYLMGKASANEIVQRGPIDNLYFIPGGTKADKPADLAGNGRFELLLDELRDAFDWVVLDSSPVVPIGDAPLLARSCDGVLLVVQTGATHVELAQQAVHEFRNANILGVVLNHAEQHRHKSAYYYSHKEDVAKTATAAESN